MVMRCIPRYLLFIFIIEQFNIEYASTSWASSIESNVQLLGIFPDAENTSEPTAFSVHSRAMFKAAIILSQKYNMKFDGNYIGWEIVQTGGDSITALSGTCEAVSTLDIIGIVGPAYSREAHLIAPFAGSVGIPDISHATTDPDLSDRNAYSNFYRTVSSDNAAAIAIGKLFIRYNWTTSVIVYQNDAYGSGGADILSQVFTDIGVTVRQSIIFDLATKTIRGDLKGLIAGSSTRIVILWADPVNTILVLQFALESDVLSPQYQWILSANIPLDSFDQPSQQKLVGMLTVEPVVGSVVNAPINTTLLNAAYNIWQQYEPETFPGVAHIDYYAVFAFDATWALILSLQQICSSSNSFDSSCTAWSNSSYCFDRQFLNSELLLNSINNIAFLGVSGPVQFSVNTTDRIQGIYYVARNSQFNGTDLSFIPVLNYSDSNNWNAFNNKNKIVWTGNSSIPPTDRVILDGVVLRIAVLESPPFLMVTYEMDTNGENTTKFIGYMPDLITNLQSQMKFIPKLILVPSDRTYADVIQDVANGVYDMMIADVEITSERLEMVSFSSAIFDNSVSIVMRQTPLAGIDMLSFLKPFTSYLWLVLFGTIVYSGVLICFLEREANEALRNRSISSLFFMSVWYGIGVIVGYGVDFHVRTAAGRLLTAGLYIVSIVFVATYTANLASYLTISKSGPLVAGLDDIKNGKLTFNRIGIRVGTEMEDFYLREISGGNRNYYSLKSFQQQYTSLINDAIDATFMDTGTAQYITNNIYCNLTIIGASFDQNSFGIVMPKQWLYIQDVDIAVLSLREAGILDGLRTKWFLNQICPGVDDPPTAMDIGSMAGLFLTFAIISILSVLLFMWRTRLIILDYLLNIAHRKHFLTHIHMSMIRKTPQSG